MEIHEFEISKWLEDLFDVRFCEVKVQGSHIKSIKSSEYVSVQDEANTYCMAPCGALTPGGRLRFLGDGQRPTIYHCAVYTHPSPG